MSPIGTVLETDGNRAEVSTSREDPCGGCSERSACGMGLFAKPREVLLTAENRVNARPGDTVELALSAPTALRLSLLVWILPLAGLIAGAVLGVALHERLRIGEDPAALLGAAVGVVASALLLVRYDRRAARDRRLVPRIVKVVSRGAIPDRPHVDASPIRRHVGAGGNSCAHPD
jgi:sigma-E factor negative regulatory protein RseC